MDKTGTREELAELFTPYTEIPQAEERQENAQGHWKCGPGMELVAQLLCEFVEHSV